jgi:hypothetical protein
MITLAHEDPADVSMVEHSKAEEGAAGRIGLRLPHGPPAPQAVVAVLRGDGIVRLESHTIYDKCTSIAVVLDACPGWIPVNSASNAQ